MTAFKLLVSTGRAENSRMLPVSGRFRRIKTILSVLLGTSVLIGFILASLLLGFVIATSLIILVVAAVTVAATIIITHHVRRKYGL